MADRLARIYCTEYDQVNCPFYFKMGACRYGQSCQRIHNKPPMSQTLMLQHIYENSPVEAALATGNTVSPEDAEKAMTKFEQFYENVFEELSQYGEIEDMIVVDNLGDHIAGNLYVRFSEQEYAEKAMLSINGRFFNGRKIDAQYSPAGDFDTARCRQYRDGTCKRGAYCNYMHIKPISRSFKRELFEKMYLEHPDYRQKKRQEPSRSRSRGRRGGRREERGRDRGDRDRGDRGGDRERDRDRDRGDRERNRDRSGRDDKDRSERDRDRDRGERHDRHDDRKHRKRSRSRSDEKRKREDRDRGDRDRHRKDKDRKSQGKQEDRQRKKQREPEPNQTQY